jgi:hypothetical protein
MMSSSTVQSSRWVSLTYSKSQDSSINNAALDLEGRFSYSQSVSLSLQSDMLIERRCAFCLVVVV